MAIVLYIDSAKTFETIDNKSIMVAGVGMIS